MRIQIDPLPRQDRLEVGRKAGLRDPVRHGSLGFGATKLDTVAIDCLPYQGRSPRCPPRR